MVSYTQSRGKLQDLYYIIKFEESLAIISKMISAAKGLKQNPSTKKREAKLPLNYSSLECAKSGRPVDWELSLFLNTAFNLDSNSLSLASPTFS